MPPASDDPSEDYIASLLKREAAASLNQSSSSTSFDALDGSTRRPNPSTRKPNLRFLNNIIRETDNHNLALKLRELEQAGDRLRKLRGDPPRASERPRDEGRDESPRARRRSRSRSREERKRRRRTRSRSPGAVDGGHGGRRRAERREDVRHERRRDKGHEEMVEDERYEGRRWADERRPRDRGGRDRVRERSMSSGDGSGHVRSERRHGHHRSRRRREDSRHRDEDLAERSGKRMRDHRLSPHRSARKSESSGSPTRGSRLHDILSSGRLKQKVSSTSQPTSRLEPSPEDHQQIVRRGRGAHTAAGSAMDARFLATYDPKTDIQPENLDDTGDDWDRSMEALRDRALWQKSQGERLRAAGFSDEQMEKWERGKKEEDVVWKTKAEGREWDRGKVVREDGTVATNASWTNDPE